MFYAYIFYTEQTIYFFFFLCYTYCDNFLNIRIIIFYINSSTCKHLYYKLNDSMMFEINI